jgi:guanylate cyclase
MSPQVPDWQLHAALWPFEPCTEQLALPLESQLMVKVRVTLPSQAVPQAELALPGHWVCALHCAQALAPASKTMRVAIREGTPEPILPAIMAPVNEVELTGISSLSRPPGPFRRALLKVADMASGPHDKPDERVQKRLQIIMALASVPAVGGWGLSFSLIGRSDAALFPYAYCAGTLTMLLLLRLTRAYSVFRWAHPLLVLFGPYSLQLYLGGFAGSGGAVMWSLISPVAAMMFVGPKRSVIWVVLLAAMMVADVLREVLGPVAPSLTTVQATAYFGFNTLGLVFFLFFSTRYFTARIQLEQERSESLLLNILPAPIAARLKRGPQTIAERFGSVSVVFSDLVGFTQLSARMDAQALVELLDEIFTEFDRLADRHGLEKIKTIGDAYMVVAGLPEPCEDHAVRAARMALAMRDFMVRFSADRGLGLKMRIGVHTGEVVAGVIGRRKFSYDLWGDTVNTASRMESHGEAGRVHVTEVTQQALGAKFECTDRGTLTVKGKGEMHTFFLEKEATAAPG